MMEKVLGYMRVSTAKQSMERQKVLLENVCCTRGVELVDVFSDDGVSGRIPLYARVGGAKLLAGMRKTPAVIVTRWDRLFRRSDDCACALESWGKHVSFRVVELGAHPIKVNATWRFLLMSLAAASEQQMWATSEGTKLATQMLIADGAYTGGKPVYGRDTVTEQVVVERISDLHASKVSLRCITATLKSEGVVGRTGKPLALTQVARVVKRLGTQ